MVLAGIKSVGMFLAGLATGGDCKARKEGREERNVKEGKKKLL